MKTYACKFADLGIKIYKGVEFSYKFIPQHQFNKKNKEFSEYNIFNHDYEKLFTSHNINYNWPT